MLSKISDETFDGGRTFDDFRSDLEIALSMTRLTAHSDHERVGIVNIMGLLTQSDNTTLEQVTQQEMSKETRQAERKDSRLQIQGQMLSGGIGPVAGPLLENGRCLEFHRNLQIPIRGHQLVRKTTEGSFEINRQAAKE